jgi:hypothetical protein
MRSRLLLEKKHAAQDYEIPDQEVDRPLGE